MNKQPDMIYQGQLTEAGREVVTYLEGLCKQADEQRTAQLSGHVGYYYVNVYKRHAITAERFVEDFANSMVAATWRDMEFLKENAATAAVATQTQQATSDIAAKLEALGQQLAAVVAELADLKKKPRKVEAKADVKAEPVADEPVADETPVEGEADASQEA